MSTDVIALPKTHPWRRYFARTFDYLAFTLVVSILGGLLIPDQIDAINDKLFGILLIALYIPFEGVCLAAFGRTAGKALYGIRLVPREGAITLSTAFWRSLLVWLKGEGVGIPLVALITNIVAFNRLNRTGSTSWDDDIGWKVEHSLIGAGRWIGILGAWAAVILVFGALVAIGAGM